LYDHEVAYLDTQLARVLDVVGRSKRPVAVFVSADHGEGFNSVTRYHGDTLDDPVIRIPLLARVPGWPARRIEQPVSSIDLIPTILALIHAPIPHYLDGIDLATTLDDDHSTRMLFSDTWRYDPAGNVLRDVSAAYDADYKFILDRRSGILYRAYQVESRWDEHLLAVGLTGDVPKVVYGHLEAFGPLRLGN
jgi:arylsulfatase A-like enzyme